MLALFLGAVGWLAFVLGALLLGLSLRRRPSRDHAERYSRLALRLGPGYAAYRAEVPFLLPTSRAG